MRRVGIVVIAALVGGGCLGAGAGPAAAQTPGTLVGETLQATPAYDAHGDCASAGQCVQATATCDPDLPCHRFRDGRLFGSGLP
jgi:hypothetical protein